LTNRSLRPGESGFLEEDDTVVAAIQATAILILNAKKIQFHRGYNYVQSIAESDNC